MSPVFEFQNPDPVIHLKAYGGLKIFGEERDDIQYQINSPELATLFEKEGHVYITANATCQLHVPIASSIEIEKGMGSVSIENIESAIAIEKAFGNLVLSQIGSAKIEKVGGNFSVRNTTGSVKIEKVGGSLVVDAVSSFQCEKVGGNCTARNVEGDFSIEKVGGNLLAQDVGGNLNVDRVGGSLTGQNISPCKDLRAGGSIRINRLESSDKLTSLRAGGDITLALDPGFEGAGFYLKSGSERIQIHWSEEDLDLNKSEYEYRPGNASQVIDLTAGGQISLVKIEEPLEDIVDDISDQFTHEESAFSELIQERVEAAMRKADAKMKAAEFRLEHIREKIEDTRDFALNVDFDPGDPDFVKTYKNQPTPPVVVRPIGKKGATDEERLMILQMLQDKQITVDEAETLFRALED